MSKLLSIIIPVFNEERLIKTSLPKIANLNINKELLVVNDGSSDNSLIYLQELQTKYDFKLINLPKNQGKGAAVKEALNYIKGDYFIVCDADLEYQAQDIINLFNKILELDDKTAVYGSRFKGKRNFGFHYFINQILTQLINILFNSRLTDMETCFKMMPRSALGQINLSGQRFELEPEITISLIRAGYNIYELPITYIPRNYKQGKKIKPRDGFLAIKTILKHKFKK